MVHISDLSWDEAECTKMLQNYKKGEKLTVKILEINIEKERISLGIKQLTSDPVQEFIDKNPLKSKVSGKIISIEEKGIKIDLGSNIIGFIKKSNLSKEKSEQKVERYAVDENVDSMIVSIDQKTRNVSLSIKDLEIKDEKDALNKYGSSDSGASLGDILGSVLDKKKDN
jgi:Ribosomal protein S1